MRRRRVKVPQVMQMEALECGAACLTMVLAYYGRWVSLEQMRVECGVSRNGSKALNIVKAARNYGLAARGITCGIEALKKIELPCILFWDFRHFVVLSGISDKYAYINDPARGELRVPMDEFSESFTGIVLRFAPNKDFQPGGAPPSVLDFVRRRLKGMGPAIAFVCATAALTSLISIASTTLSQVFLDRVLPSGSSDSATLLACIMLSLALASGIVTSLSAIYVTRIQGKTAVVASSRFMRHLLHLPSGFYEQRMVGDLQQRQTSNEMVVAVLIGQLAPVVINAAMLVLYLLVMLRYSVPLTCLGVSTVIINAWLARYMSRKRVNISRKYAASQGKEYSVMVAGIDAIETIKAAGAETGYFQTWSGYQAVVGSDNARTVAVNEYLGNAPALLVELANIGVLVLGTWLIVRGHFSVGALLAFQGLLASFMVPVTQIINLGQTVQETQTQMERIEDVMRYEADVPERRVDDELEQAREFGSEKLAGDLELSHVTFGYSPLDEPIIQDFNLKLERGKWVALVGSSGSGKSTLSKLISGLYKPWSGTIAFGGTPLEDIPRPVLRGSLSVVDQDIAVFNDTIASNVRMWDGSIADFDVILACRDAQIHKEVLSRDQGYQTQVLPGGRNFSGGQLQRLEIARALANDPSIIILDEATSALDAKTEELVMRRIRDRDITCIVVAHRLSTIRDCDEIVVLDQGTVVERGTHEQLMQADGAYAKLVRSD
ncbi:MAG: NHLP family bacteriocin export ABC transporter peptidase/permease/ATPase subunit [Coriobacteriales bacterium]|nr:NHLP family bacteriocin export ABC transporter peptidase/permease/ATPase subunit [Coriobacteriales bacterium]